MKLQNRLFLASAHLFLILSLAGCAGSAKDCQPSTPVDLNAVDAWAGDAKLPFRFPLDGSFSGAPEPISTGFCEAGGRSGPEREYHAAEDFLRPAGTPVYAMADGDVSFSGPMGGYGWLVIIDHPQADFYSLYGHLSPSRWRIEPGPVKKGDLIAYLGADDENGGSAEDPLRPHLHLGLRAGQRADYPGMGEWRWQAGWIKPCPRELGWLQPSAIINSQETPAGFQKPASAFLAIWGMELLMNGVYLLGAGFGLVYAIRRDKPLMLIIWGATLAAAGWIFHSKGVKSSYLLLALAPLLFSLGIYRFLRRPRETKTEGAY